jgi:hypothetical protein
MPASKNLHNKRHCKPELICKRPPTQAASELNYASLVLCSYIQRD